VIEAHNSTQYSQTLNLRLINQVLTTLGKIAMTIELIVTPSEKVGLRNYKVSINQTLTLVLDVDINSTSHRFIAL